MTLRLQIQIVGTLLIGLALAHIFFNRYFGWKRELSSVSLLTRRIFQVHCFFIALVLALMGVASLFYADSLLESSPLSRLVLAGAIIFWSCRLITQFFVYDGAIWRGHRLYTSMHVLFSALWSFVVITYGTAFWSVL